jgi:alpha-tubulin suppressor-like RCC1 family protein
MHSLATKTDGTLWSWGVNGSGQLGQNDTTYISSPVQIPGTSWSSISGGDFISNQD